MKEYLEKAKAIMHLADIALVVSPDEHTAPEDLPIRKAQYDGIATAIGALEDMKGIDSAVVVRCGECKKNGLLECPLVMIEKRQMVFINRSDDWFCADGETEE